MHRRPLIMTNMSHLRRAQCRLGIYDRQELSELAKVNIEAMKAERTGGEAQACAGLLLEHKYGVLSINFTVQLA